jgi:hypothetical protein
MALGKLLAHLGEITHVYRRTIDDRPAGCPTASKWHALDAKWEAAVVRTDP